MDPKFIEASLGNVGGLLGEANTYSEWVEANKTPTPQGSGFNKRLIVLGKYKLLSLKKGTFGNSVELNFHLLNITEINYLDNDETLVIKYKELVNDLPVHGGLTIRATFERIQHLLRAIRKNIRLITHGITESHALKLNYPEDKLLAFDEPLPMSSANGYVDTYIANSWLYKTVATVDYVRYIEGLAQNGLDELDFTQSAGNDPNSEYSFNLFTALVALAHNTFFKSVNLSALPHANIVNALALALETNQTLTKLNLSDLRIEQSFQPIANALVKNTQNAVHSLDLSKNNIAYPAMMSLCTFFSKMQHGLVSLDLSNCDLKPRCVVILFQAFERNFGMSLAIKSLNLSNNKPGDSGQQAIASWMSKIKGCNKLSYLNLSNCGINFSIMGPALGHVDVAHLCLSGNKIDKNAAKLLAENVLNSTENLLHLDLSNCWLGYYPLEHIFSSLNLNKRPARLNINLSNNGLSASEASVIGKYVGGIQNLSGLDLSHNKLPCRALIDILGSIRIMSNCNLHQLNLSNNYFAEGAEGEHLCNLIAKIINSVESLKAVNLSGGKYPLGKALVPLFGELAKSITLKEIDLSDNALGDWAASSLGEVLRHNSALNYINLDNNQFSLQGWTSIAQPLLFDVNRSLNHLEISRTIASVHTSSLVSNFKASPVIGGLSSQKKCQLVGIFIKIQNKVAENRFESSMNANAYVSEYAGGEVVNRGVEHVVEAVPLVAVPVHLAALPLPMSPRTDATTPELLNAKDVAAQATLQDGAQVDQTLEKPDVSNDSLRISQTRSLPTIENSDWQPDDTSEFEHVDHDEAYFYELNSDGESTSSRRQIAKEHPAEPASSSEEKQQDQTLLIAAPPVEAL
ncbi:hypothetical protein SAMD00019534_111200 [Acytostelium subglobosum LB1]|uniref:hypothetical protein n=1 Tax=Acytostelium subglobosum LB1 TaxID=1410327 RepID=UPI000644CA1A|nr:hypothetical protein SAMD00019534_111200 [Acytostelium subglobosum LB1]GAM27944.1 hypothetical protein SAMD00019534_111200 [Acytostelium subglobosum LB1]|eukprot:XP_012749227.1 hypothetical protein SAMD00019534_111200 [Acytostelium subglobosum LB1]